MEDDGLAATTKGAVTPEALHSVLPMSGTGGCTLANRPEASQWL